LLVCLSSGTGSADDASGWRGDGSGRFPDAKPPLGWTGSAAGNIRWKTEVGRSMSSPVVVGDRVFVTAEPDLLVCVDRDSGQLLWKQRTQFEDLPEKERVKPEKTATECGYSTPTPVSDGKRVAVVFGTGLIACYDLEGRRQWIRHGGYDSTPQYGRSASPVIVDGKLIVSVSYLQAFDLQTGRSLWKAEKSKERYGSPLVTQVGDVPVVVTGGGEAVRVRDGTILASGIGLSEHVTPIRSGRVIYFIDAESRAVELPEKAADTVQVKELWKRELDGEYFASPVLHDGLIHTVNAKGEYTVLDAATGKIVQEKELNLPARAKSTRVPKFYPSLVLAGSVLFVGDDGGGSLWLKPGRTYAEASRNLLEEGAAGTPACTGTRVFLRGGHYLFCLGEK
jgi:outer membrane protein assembly factor BamB